MPKIVKILKGVLAAAAVTMLLMALVTALILYRGISSGTLVWINQGIKLLSIVVGTVISVGRGGEKGLVTGMITGILYILVGYGVYCIADGSNAGAAQMAIEEAAGALTGGIAGVMLANMKPRRRAAAR